ncbi:unannotated protein [freshwater metagenome]|uniref:Unannotated protein n=1 Tax=freshwater metagenome TaxID=449393 RepID=A0A6J7BYZ8_9ZZZZ
MHAEAGDRQKVRHGLGDRAVPVVELLGYRRHVILGGSGGEALIGLETQPLLGHVGMRNVRVDRHLNPDVENLLSRPALAVLSDSLSHEPDVEVEPDIGDMAALLATKEIARAADLEVLHRHGHARAEIGVRGNRGEPVMGGVRERLLGRVEEVRITALAATSDPAAQLVQLRQTERIGTIEDEGVGIGDVQAALDDRRRDENVEFLLPEVDDHLLERMLVHLSVRGPYARLGHEIADLRGNAVN